jgi:hypothetical protein
MVIVKEREFQLSLRRVLIVVGRVLIVVDQNGDFFSLDDSFSPQIPHVDVKAPAGSDTR